MNVLILNAGSSSLKFQVIATDLDRIKKASDERLCRGQVERIGGEAIVTVQNKNGPRRKLTAPIRDVAAALDYVLRWLASDTSEVAEIRSLGDLHAVGHRVVHGGEMFHESALITDDVLKGIEDCIDLAPLHNPNNIKGILAVREIFGRQTPQVAVFDTAFHSTIAEQAYLYALPYHLYRRHRIRRYGFHGTSHRYVAYRYRMLRSQPGDAPPGQRLLGLRYSRRPFGGYVDGNDAAGGPGDGDPLRRSGSRHSEPDGEQGRAFAA
jgi:acetate kinase